MAASRSEALARRRATYQDVLDAPEHSGRRDRRGDAVHPSAASTATYTGKLRARRKDRHTLRFRRRGPGGMVDPRRTGASPRRRHSSAGSRGLAPGADGGPARYAVLPSRARLGVRGPVGLDAKAGPSGQASGLCPRRASGTCG